MKFQAIALSLLICVTLPARGDDVADWWQAYETDSKLVTLPDGKQLSLLCIGEGTPVVILEAGLGSSMTAWRTVQAAIGRVTQTCAYSRAGLGDSAPTDGPRDAGAEADDLAALLNAAKLAAPYVLVGHSYGGFVTRLYASRHTSDVEGLLLVDPSSAYQLDRMREAVAATAIGIAAADAQARDCAVDPRPADLVALCQPPPPADMPPALTARWISSQDPVHIGHVARERAAWNGLSSDLLDQEKKSLGSIPFVVLNRDPTRLDPRLIAEDNAALEQRWLQMHLEIMDLSSDSQLHIVPGAGHSIQFDRPDAVINAVTDMVWKVRRNR